jgi:protein-tyrosine phosphatase
MTAARTDIHFHLLPGVDDGPATATDSVTLARAAVRDGTGTIVATPHVRSDFVTDVWELRDRIREVKAALAREGVPVSVVQGAELGHDMVGRLRQDELEAIAQGPPLRRWLLVETPFTGIGADFNRATDELRDRGFGVVLAHPERAGGLLDSHRAGLDHELAAGSALQVNGLSLTGHHGEVARRAALLLVRLGLVTAIASDAHGGARRPALTLGYAALVADGVAPGVARTLTDSGPRRLMARGLEPVPVPLA